MDTQEIQIGDKVRSFDFPDRSRNLTGETAAYVEGVVEDFEEFGGCQCYSIRVTRDVFRGDDMELQFSRAGSIVVAPVNGTKTLFGDVTNGVEKI